MTCQNDKTNRGVFLNIRTILKDIKGRIFNTSLSVCSLIITECIVPQSHSITINVPECVSIRFWSAAMILLNLPCCHSGGTPPMRLLWHSVMWCYSGRPSGDRALSVFWRGLWMVGHCQRRPPALEGPCEGLWNFTCSKMRVEAKKKKKSTIDTGL